MRSAKQTVQEAGLDGAATKHRVHAPARFTPQNCCPGSGFRNPLLLRRSAGSSSRELAPTGPAPEPAEPRTLGRALPHGTNGPNSTESQNRLLRFGRLAQRLEFRTIAGVGI